MGFTSDLETIKGERLLTKRFTSIFDKIVHKHVTAIGFSQHIGVNQVTLRRTVN
jgi:hypothetical protein